jgi:hypothetical protein
VPQFLRKRASARRCPILSDGARLAAYAPAALPTGNDARRDRGNRRFALLLRTKTYFCLPAGSVSLCAGATHLEHQRHKSQRGREGSGRGTQV